MQTLSLDLRGRGSTPSIPEGSNIRGAGISVLVHGIGITALVLVPLLGSSDLPTATNALRSLLITPVLPAPLPPPPAPPQGANRPPGNKPTQTAAVLVQLSAPKDTPNLISTSDLLDTSAAVSIGPVSDVGPGTSSSPGGDCQLGALCGQFAMPTPTPQTVVQVGGRIKEPRLSDSRAPVYPEIARAAGVPGLVILEAHVGTDGRVKEARVLRSAPLFDEAALTSVRSRRYEPLLLNGVPTEFLVTITVSFNLR